jgi:UPF0716 protein FxsA
MFLFVLIAVPLVEAVVFIEVAQAIGWLVAFLLLLATSVLGIQLLRIQGRAAIQRVSLAVSERRAPGAPAVDGALGLLGAALLALPGFVTDALGLLLLFRPSRDLVRWRLSRHYAARVMSFLARTGRFYTGTGTGSRRWADVDSTAAEDDLDRLDR